MDVLIDFLNQAAIIGPLIAWILTLIPGPFRSIAHAVINWLLERARERLEQTANTKAEVAVLSAEDKLVDAKQRANTAAAKREANDRALRQAIEDAKRYGLVENTEDRVRAAYRRLKGAGMLPPAP